MESASEEEEEVEWRRKQAAVLRLHVSSFIGYSASGAEWSFHCRRRTGLSRDLCYSSEYCQYTLGTVQWRIL